MSGLNAIVGRHARLDWAVINPIVLATLLMLSSPQSISVSVPWDSVMLATEQDQAAPIDLSGRPTALIALSSRPDADTFLNINQLLNAGNYQLAIVKAHAVIKKRPNSGLANEILGTAYFLSGKHQKAISPLKKAIKLEPEQSGPPTKLGIIKMESGKLDEAEKLLLKAVHVNPKHRYAHQRLGLLYEYKKNISLAIHHFHHGLIGTGNDYLGVAVNLARLLSKVDQPRRAIAVLAPRLPLKSTYPEAHLILGTAYLETEQFTAAIARFERLGELESGSHIAEIGRAAALRGLGEHHRALRMIDTLLVERPDWVHAHVERGQTLLALGRLSSASSAFDEAEKRGAKRAHLRKRVAKFHLDQKAFIEAEAVYSELIEHGEADPETYALYSELQLAKGRRTEAEAALHAGIARHPQSGYLHLRLGAYLASTQQYTVAAKTLRRANELLPNNPIVLRTYSLVQSRLGDHAGAAHTASQLYALLPNRIEAGMQYASMLEANKRSSEAEAVYRQIVNADVDNALALNNLANLLAYRDALPEAEEMARRANQAVSNNAQLMDTLGWILYKQGRLKEAAEVFKNARMLLPNIAIIRYHEGIVLAEIGDKLQARIALTQALEMDESADWVGDARARLDSVQ